MRRNVRFVYNPYEGAPVPKPITNADFELDELQVIGGSGFEESVKYFVSGSGKNVPLGNVPEHIRKGWKTCAIARSRSFLKASLSLK